MAPVLEKYKDALPIPKVIKPVGKKNGQPYYELEMTEFYQNLHSDMGDTKLWGYNKSYPGPIIEVQKDKPVYVRWINNLPDKHFLPIDKTIHGAKHNPEVRTVVHLHGLNVRPESDGFPDDWYTPGKSALYYYPNRQPAATLWYHDHAIGITRLNVYAGLAGMYLIRDKHEEDLNLPSGEYEIPLIIQDRDFNDDGSLSYPAPNINGVQPSITPGFFGSYALVNGKVWPHLYVKPRKYRFRILNGSNSRNYRLRFAGTEGQILPAWYQIGTDGGFLEKPVKLSSLSCEPAERADVIIDFTGLANQTYTLVNDAVPPFGTPLQEIMQFRVLDTPVKDNSRLPLKLNNIRPLPLKRAKQRYIDIIVGTDDYLRLMFMLENKTWTDPATIKAKLGSVEVWNIVSTGAGAHPIHVHLVQFQILNRQAFDVGEYISTKKLKFIGPPVLPDENEKGWKDTVRADPGTVTRIAARFGDFTGTYPFHCHILEHEDHDMMRPFIVYKEKCTSDDEIDAFIPCTNMEEIDIDGFDAKETGIKDTVLLLPF
ncbi:MAG TPA: multicopper oxidase domain-containing protein [Clostridiaceae bacterium]|nr:multicopper oxidase domain-containing protein [Clostridiaceae bacterium]